MTSSKSQWDEVQEELLGMNDPPAFEKCLTLAGSPVGHAHSIHFSLQGVQGPTGRVYSLSVRDGEFPDSNIIVVQDEKLLAKLRSINGQLVYEGLPIFYDEHLSEDGVERAR
jgi:hypothetical protein